MNKPTQSPRRIGVWIDHSKALMFDPNNAEGQIEAVHSGQESQERHRGEHGDGTRLGNFRSTDNEFHKNRKEENTIKSYFKHLANRLEAYDEIFLCGPGQARKEFQNLLSEDKHFNSKHISSEACDQLSENQLRAQVRKHFDESLTHG
ncbi:MAG: hypothetical protein RLZZ630_127 [Bacteroidota bacterium]|jgi:hypothetical protein